MRTDALIDSGFVFVVSADGCEKTLKNGGICQVYEQKSDKPGTSSTDSDHQLVNKKNNNTNNNFYALISGVQADRTCADVFTIRRCRAAAANPTSIL